jgi:hypothetical protein
MMVHGGHWGAPSVIAAFASFVHDRERSANYERNDDNDSYYGSVHCNLPDRSLPLVNARERWRTSVSSRAPGRASSPSAMGFLTA